MGGTVVPGKQFQNREQVTAAKLMQMWYGASLSGFAQSDMASGAGLHIASGTAPSDTDAIWYDTTLQIERIYNGSVWQPIGGQGIVLTNQTVGTIVAGDVVVIDTSNDSSFLTTTSAGNTRVIGVAAETIAASASGVIWTRGNRNVNIVESGSIAGTFIKTSTTAKKATATGAPPTGSGWFGVVTGIATSGIRTCLLFGQPTI